MLLVEDSPTDAKLVAQELRRIGRSVDFKRVEDAVSMRAALEEAPWDLVISDWSMPHFSALAALSVLVETGRDLPFIVVSGTIGEETAVEAMRAGAHDYVLKDRLTRLVPAVERELRECAGRHARRSAEAALRASEERYRRIIETTNEGVWMIDAEAKTTFVNDRMAAILGCEPSAMKDRSPLDFLSDDGRQIFYENFPRIETGRAEQIEVRFIRSDGTVVWTLLEANPIFDATGRFESALAMVMDITERKRAEERVRMSEAALRQTEDQLRQAQKMEAVGRLAGGVAHDFNNMLSVILSFSALAVADLKEGDPLRDDLDQIHQAGTRAADLTRQLLMFSRQQVIEPRVLDLNEVLIGMERMLRRLLGEDIELATVPTPGIGRVLVDPSSIEQVVMNLVVNARDAMPTGGNLTIETANVTLDAVYAQAHHGIEPGAFVMLAVTDSGTGMDKATQARIFEPFFTTKEVGKGTGLGLSTVFGIVQQNRGSIWVYSELGQGTTFKVYLPRVSAEADTLRPAAAISMLPGHETILLVEDEDLVRVVAETILRRHGYMVIVMRNAAEALLHCEQHGSTIDLLLTDVVMPQMSGPELARRLAMTRPAMKVLCMSGYTDDSIVRHGVLASSIAFLQKPLTPEVLVRKVREVLDAPRVTSA